MVVELSARPGGDRGSGVRLRRLLAEVVPPDAAVAVAAGDRMAGRTKPRGSLGQLEDVAVRYAAGRAGSTVGRSVLAAHHGATTVLVTHGGVVRALLAHVLGMADRDVFVLDQAYGAVNVVDFFGNTPLVRLVNGRW